MSTKVPTATELIAKVSALRHSPVAFQALWDGDTNGWWLELEVVFATGTTHASSTLALLQFGGDIRLFQGAVPPWPESTVAAELGAALAERFGVPFWFPSPNQPDDDCPRWWERDRAIHCEDCGKSILRPDSPHRSGTVCFHCQLRREARARLRADEPSYADGVTVLVDGGDELRRHSYASNASSLRIARFALHTLARSDEARTTGELVIAGDDLRRFEADLRTEIAELLVRFDQRPPGDDAARFRPPRKVVFEGRELELDVRFDPLAEQLADAISNHHTASRAIHDGLRYWLVFRRGMTARADRVIRALRQLDGSAPFAALADHCAADLDEVEVRAVVSQLVALGHVRVDGEAVQLTRTGQHV